MQLLAGRQLQEPARLRGRGQRGRDRQHVRKQQRRALRLMVQISVPRIEPMLTELVKSCVNVYLDLIFWTS